MSYFRDGIVWLNDPLNWTNPGGLLDRLQEHLIITFWAVLIGWFAFSQWPGVEILAGGVIVALAGLFVLWREHRLGLVRLRQVETGSTG